MGTVIVALERGFSGHHVVVTVDDVTVLDATNVTTDPSGTVAGSVAAECGRSCLVRVSLPELGLATERDVAVDELTYLRVHLEDGERLVLIPSVEGPRYI